MFIKQRCGDESVFEGEPLFQLLFSIVAQYNKSTKNLLKLV